MCLSHVIEGSEINLEDSSEGVHRETVKIEKAFDSGVPGGSARKKYEDLTTKRRDRVSTKHPKIGKLLLALTPAPQSTNAWAAGALGEIGIGKKLETLAEKYEFMVLHDRLIPDSKANIDHIAITSAGVAVIDAKNYKGVVKVKELGGIFGNNKKELWIGGRNRTKLIDGVERQIQVVEKILASSAVEMPVIGVLAFLNAEWDTYRWLLGQKEIRGIQINSKGVEPILSQKGPFGPKERLRVANLLANKLKPARTESRKSSVSG